MGIYLEDFSRGLLSAAENSGFEDNRNAVTWDRSGVRMTTEVREHSGRENARGLGATEAEGAKRAPKAPGRNFGGRRCGRPGVPPKSEGKQKAGQGPTTRTGGRGGEGGAGAARPPPGDGKRIRMGVKAAGKIFICLWWVCVVSVGAEARQGRGGYKPSSICCVSYLCRPGGAENKSCCVHHWPCLPRSVSLCSMPEYMCRVI